jgi:hypothetical protein
MGEVDHASGRHVLAPSMRLADYGNSNENSKNNTEANEVVPHILFQ